MTEQEFDVMLRAALQEAACLDGESAEEEYGDAALPEDYLPAGQILAEARFRQRGDRRRPLHRRGLQAVACLVLVTALALGGTVALNPAARAWMSRFFTQRYDDHTAFQFDGAQGDIAYDDTIWRPTWVPEGYQETEPEGDAIDSFVSYENAEGQWLGFHYMAGGTVGTIAVDNEHSTETVITIAGGCEAHLLETISPEYPSFLIWMDEEHNAVFFLDGYVDPNDLIKMAESVEAQ